MALKLVERRDIVDVEPMDKEYAVVLLETKLKETKLPIQDNQKDLVDLVAELEFMPLAIVQAAAYISEGAGRCSVRRYIEKFQESSRSKMNLLAYPAGHLRRDRDADNSIITTWEISFDQIQEERPSAADLLSLMSFFDRQGIPKGLLQHRIETDIRDLDNSDGSNEEDSGSKISVSDEFEKDVMILRNYSFIFIDIDNTTFEMHRLVQLATQTWLKGHNQLERWRKEYIRNLCAEFPPGDYENSEKCSSLFPHIQSALAQQPNTDDSLREWAKLLYNAASYALLRGNFKDAETMSVKSMKVREKQLGQHANETLNSRSMVALSYTRGGRWTEAEELQMQIMETLKRVLGQEHPNTLTSMANLMLTYYNQGRWAEAEELEVQVIEMRKRVSGQEHPDTLTSMGNLAWTYHSQGRWAEAEELGVQVMETRKRVLGLEHPHTLASIADFGLTYRT